MIVYVLYFQGNNSVDESDRKMIGAVEKVEACGAKSLMGMMQPVPEMTQNRWKASVHQSTSDEKLLPVKTEKGKEAFSMADLMGSTPLKKNKDDMCLADLMAANGGSKSQNNSVHSEKDLQSKFIITALLLMKLWKVLLCLI